MKVFELWGQVDLKDGDVKSKLDEIDKKAEGTGGKFDKLKGVVGKAGKAMAIGIGTGVTAMAGMVMKTTALGDEIDKHSQKLGISTDAYQEWNYVLGQNGIDMGNMDRIMRKTGEAMRAATDETSSASQAYDALGISITDSSGEMKSQEQIFDETIAGLQGIEDESIRNALATELLGSKYAELNPLLNATAEETEALKQNIHDMGGVMSEDSVKAAADFNDSMDDLKKGLSGAAMSIGSELMPMFQTLVDWVLSNMPEIQAVIKKVFEVIGKVVGVVIDIFTDFLIPIFQTLFDWTKENWPTIQTVIEGVFIAIKSVWHNVLRPILVVLWDMFKDIVKWAQENWPAIQKVIEKVFKAIKIVWDNILQPVLTVLWEMLKDIVKFVTFVFSGISKVFETTFGAIGKSVEKVTGFFTKLSDGIKDAWEWLTKWNKTPTKDKQIKGSESTKMNGSNKYGLSYVPFDGYVSELHRGERVLTKEENMSYNKNGKNAGSQEIRQEIIVNIKADDLNKVSDVIKLFEDFKQVKRGGIVNG